MPGICGIHVPDATLPAGDDVRLRTTILAGAGFGVVAATNYVQCMRTYVYALEANESRDSVQQLRVVFQAQSAVKKRKALSCTKEEEDSLDNRPARRTTVRIICKRALVSIVRECKDFCG